ncbi:MAG: hypothetical protein M0C28_20725 [Candidatus Moduliflexus flocculans]|nr:hypothetical protein [Candidatus Moduliflexus flocculans]
MGLDPDRRGLGRRRVPPAGPPLPPAPAGRACGCSLSSTTPWPWSTFLGAYGQSNLDPGPAVAELSVLVQVRRMAGRRRPRPGRPYLALPVHLPAPGQGLAALACSRGGRFRRRGAGLVLPWPETPGPGATEAGEHVLARSRLAPGLVRHRLARVAAGREPEGRRSGPAEGRCRIRHGCFLARYPVHLALTVWNPAGAEVWALALSKLLGLYTNLAPLIWLKAWFLPWAGGLGKVLEAAVRPARDRAGPRPLRPRDGDPGAHDRRQELQGDRDRAPHLHPHGQEPRLLASTARWTSRAATS